MLSASCIDRGPSSQCTVCCPRLALHLSAQALLPQGWAGHKLQATALEFAGRSQATLLEVPATDDLAVGVTEADRRSSERCRP